ncbi:hypothetical protein [Flavobacterium sp. 7A]|uniref:hypothetical protein n=1 Tax=Flavobacterium sp. 7A TaxID=2940571 RepID=UPI00222672DC|nr:hypothetical protein [Flavobacterium sp. 7A]MCW2119784.1 hypothetical protein [Flavobacterium sp. 7A]
MNTNNKQTSNYFSASMTLEINLEGNFEEDFFNMHKSLLQTRFANNNEILVSNDNKETLETVFIGFSIASGNDRATKAIELALLPLLVNLHKNIYLFMSSYYTEISIAEVGFINDFIQEKSGFDAHIVMMVSEDDNLGDAIAITVITAENLKLR